jgi:2-polyprenyl-3-methyl-5-hydroxy-6-metoxy-1,4-benzoquinol methylase
MSDITAQKVFYSDWWSSAGFANSMQASRCASIIGELASLELDRPRILDMGCGTGWLTSILSEFGEVVGVDLAPEAARKRYPHIQFIAADITKWQPELGRFDIVVSQEVIEHVLDQAGLVGVVHRLLRPRGYLILTTPNARITSHGPEEWTRRFRHQPVENHLTVTQLRHLLSSSFNILRTKTVLLETGRSGLPRLISSSKLRNMIKYFHLRDTYEQVVLDKLRYGLHIVVLAQAQ